MAYYVINETTLPLRVIAWRVKGEPAIKLLLAVTTNKAPYAMIDITLRKNVHQKARLPGIHKMVKVDVVNRARVTTKLVTNKKGVRFLYIKSILN
ncbi:MAG: hypothetical protein U9Q03_05980 [Patescibacteria group bacterium]|nr:hypothetical protein [Patescibacteria group bacterium]